MTSINTHINTVMNSNRGI